MHIQLGYSHSGHGRMSHSNVLAVMPEPLSEATKILGARIRTRREALGLSQEKAAVACGVHWTHLGATERGMRNVSLHNLLKIAKGLEIDPGKLVKELEPP